MRSTTSITKRPGYRLDIQGLRAIAVILVAFQHASVPYFTGGYVGVDVFFVISGYLITGWLLRERSRTGHIAFRRFYAARARRILPAAVLTLVATDVASRILLNPVRALSAFHDSVWAAFFVANVHFSRIATDYFANTSPPSPVQQFWSLAVEEQFYLLWPAILMAAAYVIWRPRVTRSRRGRSGMRLRWPTTRHPNIGRMSRTLTICILLSFVWSIVDTRNHAAAAYFSSFARIWELGVGALLAVSPGLISRVSPRLRSMASWAGLAGIFASAVLYGSDTPFPGYAALVPVFGAAFVITGGMGPAPLAAGAILAREPFRFIGDVSYSFYLWHWPVLILATEHIGHALSFLSSFLLLCLAFAISVVSYFAYEDPLRRAVILRKRRWSFLWLWLVGIAGVVATASLLGSAVNSELASDSSPSTFSGPATIVSPPKGSAATSTTMPGTATTTSEVTDPFIAAVKASVSTDAYDNRVPNSLSPSYETLATDFPGINGCIAHPDDTAGPICHFGSTASRRLLIVFGDSHAQMWMTPLIAYGASHGWDLIPLIKVGCQAYAAVGPDATGSCAQWYAWALNELRLLKPDAIVFSESYTFYEGQEEASLNTQIDALRALSPRVAVFENTPLLKSNPIDCLLAPNATLGSCTVSATNLAANHNAVRSLTQADGVSYLPTLQWFCYDNLCPTVIGNIIAYTDAGHISNTYANYLSVPLAKELVQALG